MPEIEDSLYKDKEGSRWLCVSSAGTYDQSPYSEFISLEGILTTSAFSAATNLPTLRQALRAMGYIAYLASYLTSNSVNTTDFYNYTNKNFTESGKVSIGHLVQRVVAQWDKEGYRYDTQLFDFAYDDGQTSQQALCRLVINHQNDQGEAYYHFYTRYPKQPSSMKQTYSAEELGNVPIRLQDLTSADMVKQYAEDTYARQPISIHSGGDGRTPRQPRSTTEPGADDVRNYFYDHNKWMAYNYPTDMWGTPLLFFRYTRAYDRGDAEYAQTTVDGQKLSLYSPRVWSDSEMDEETMLKDMKARYQTLPQTVKTYHLNGEPYDYPTWQNVNNDW